MLLSKRTRTPKKEQVLDRDAIYVVMSPQEAASTNGMSVEDIYHQNGFQYTPDMRQYAGLEVIVAAGNNALRLKDAKTKELLPYTWTPQWIRQRDADPAEPVVETAKVEKFEGDFLVSLGGGEIQIEVKGENILPSQEEDVFIVDLDGKLEDIGASDWYTLSKLCVTNFGAGKRTHLYINGASISPVKPAP